MDLEWDEAKRRLNLAKHGIDFPDVLPVFDDPGVLIFEDLREDYGEPRFISICPIEGIVVHVSFTYRGDTIRIISARRATKAEERIYAQSKHH